MARKRPVFFFAFANDRAYRLHLEKEERAIREALRIKDSEDQIEYKSIGQTNLADIYNTFNSFHNRIYIFHYGGHSDSEFLHLKENLARTEQLAVIIGQQQCLKLVFLNGCANYEQVKELFEHGVPAVIATRADINDELSCHLAEQFYLALAAGKTIRQAFATAASYLYQLKPGLEIQHRSLKLRSADQDGLPWGLYAVNENALDWHLNLLEKESILETLVRLRKVSQERFNAFNGKGGRFQYLRIDEVILASIDRHRPAETRKLIETVIGNQKTPLENSLDILWDSECPHALLTGAGGMGKTVSLVQLWQHFLDRGNKQTEWPVPVFIPLHEFNNRPEKNFIRNYIWEQYGKIDIEIILKETHTQEKEGYRPNLILLLDGLNEVTAESNELFLELNELRTVDKYPGLQIILTSRGDIRQAYQWRQFHFLELQLLSDQQIVDYLKRDLPTDSRLLDLLRNPMMLSIYAAQTELPQHYQAFEFLKKTVTSTGEMLYNVEMLQRIKIEMQYFGDPVEQAFRRFVLEHLLAAIAWQMQRSGLFSLDRNRGQGDHLNMEDALCKAIVECLGKPEFFDVFPFFSEYLEEDELKNIDRKMFHKIIDQVCCRDLVVLVKEDFSYRFLHQNFRDYFAARFLQNQSRMALRKKQLPPLLKAAPLDQNLRRLLGELEAEHYNGPKYLAKERSWNADHGTKHNLLTQMLALCRGEYDLEKLGYLVWNILTIWSELRGELSGENLDRLHFQSFSFNEKRFSRPGLIAGFKGAVIDQNIFLPSGHAEPVNCIAFSPDGKHIITGSNDEAVKVWDARSGQFLQTFQGFPGSVNCAVFSRDGHRILTGSNDHKVKVWDTLSRQYILVLEGHTDRVRGVAYDPYEQRIGSGSLDNTAKVWNVQDGQCLLTLRGHGSVVECVSFSPDGHLFVTGSWDKSVKIWDVTSGECLMTLEGHLRRITCVSFSPDGERIISGSDDETAKLWDTRTGQCLLTLEGHTSRIESVAASINGQQILTASDDGTAKIWEAAMGLCSLTLKGHFDAVISAIFDSDGQRVLTASEDKMTKVWDVKTGYCIFTLKGYSDKITCMEYSPDGRRILVGSNDNTTKIWDVGSGICYLILQGHTAAVDCATFCPDHRYILTGSSDHTAKIWDATTGYCIITLVGHTGKIATSAWHPDKDRILTGSDDNTVKIWSFDAGNCLLTLEGFAAQSKSATFSPDGKLILFVSLNNTATIWDIHSGECLMTLKGHSERITSATFSPDGNGVYTKSVDNTTKLWNAKTGECLITLEDFLNDKPEVVYSPDKLYYLAKIGDNKIQILETDSGKVIHEITNVPGLFIQGCDFRRLHPQSTFPNVVIPVLRQYGAIFNDDDAASWATVMEKYSTIA